MKTVELVKYLDQLLSIGEFKDYCPNGLQVEGAADIQKLATSVSADQWSIDQACAWGADALLVHHGYFWRNEQPSITGMKYRRIKSLMDNDVSLIAYHLPLDAHLEFGNSVQLADKLDLTVEGTLDNDGLVFHGLLGAAMSGEQFRQFISERLGRDPVYIAPNNDVINSIAWCTGAAQGYIDQAIAPGVDAYLTGEVSEQTFHIPKEMGIHFFSAGHHATERYGVQAIAEHLEQKFAIETQFFDAANPV